MEAMPKLFFDIKRELLIVAVENQNNGQNGYLSLFFLSGISLKCTKLVTKMVEPQLRVW